jgi:hypothetical protein
MSWLDAILSRNPAPAIGIPMAEADRRARGDAPLETNDNSEPKPDIKLVWFQIRPARGDDQGVVEAAYYSVSGDVLTMHDEQGRPTGQTHRLGKEDPQKVAGRLGRAAWIKDGREDNPFNGPLNYQPLGIA